jgi:hypothetical protein
MRKTVSLMENGAVLVIRPAVARQPASRSGLRRSGVRRSVTHMRIIYRAENVVDAHLVKDALDHVGIPAFISGEYLIGGIGQLPARDFIVVSVPDVCVEAAEPRVRALTELLNEARAAAAQDDLASGLQLAPV